MKKKTSLSDKLQIASFAAFVLAFALLWLILPDRDFSQQENRYLQQSPELTAEGFFGGEFTADFEKYLSDQFPGRDTWISVKAAAELASGKRENNGVYYCGDTLIGSFKEPDQSRVAKNLAAVNALAESAGVPVYLSLIPGAAELWPEKLPANAAGGDEAALIEQVYGGSAAVTVDNLSALREHRDEAIFYRTDHHWTTLGAYYGYEALAAAMGFQPAPLSSFQRETLTESFYGTLYSRSGFTWAAPDSIERFVSDEGVTVTNYPHGEAEAGAVYQLSRLDTKDKYSVFFGGNTPRMVIDTGREGLPVLLLLRDSFSDCQLPFLFGHFSEIHVLDLRYYVQSVGSYIQEQGVDAVLVSYGAESFAEEVSVLLAGR